MKALWRCFFWSVVGIGIFFAAFVALVAFGLSSPHIDQSNGFVEATPEAMSFTLSRTLPVQATRVRYCKASVGLGGRLRLYRFSAPAADLHTHAIAEFAEHWDGIEARAMRDSEPPVTENDLARFADFYGVEASWMLPPADSVGVLYRPADGRVSHAPTIYIDESNEVLYFVMTD